MVVIREAKGLHYYHNHYYRCADFEDKKNNNLIERWNNSYRANTPKYRGFKKLKTGNLFVRLWKFYYNFIAIILFSAGPLLRKQDKQTTTETENGNGSVDDS